MEDRKIYVIIDLNKFTKADVVQEIKEEGYKFGFFFGNVGQHTNKKEYMDACDEVWCWGNCEHIPDYNMAIERGREIWIMG